MSKTLVTIVALAPLLLLCAGNSRAAPVVDLRTMLASPVDLTVYSADRKLVIGHAHFIIKETGKTVQIAGDTRYANGEHDLERIMMEYQPGNPLPVVTSVDSNFLAPDGSAQLMEKADFKTGDASCHWGRDFGDATYQETLDFQPDSYGGAASIIPLEYALKKGEPSVRFHVFDCAPKPTLFTIDAKLANGEAHWTYYPGELAKMGLTPDLGWLNVVAQPFIPNIAVWFDPKAGYEYVGASKDRFYRGRQQILVRTANDHHVGADTARESAPSAMSVEPAKASN